MEIAFEKTAQPCLQKVKWEVRNCEETQEVRIPDEMPDVASVLGAWGQVLLRGKQWRGGEMQVTAGVMAWVLYAPEGGGEPQTLETWIPMQLRWDLPDTERDGQILTGSVLRNIDARCISVRKVMVQAGVGVLAEAVVPGELAVYAPTDLPEDVQVLTSRYPMELAAEAGEKPFTLEEVLTIPAGSPAMAKPIYYCLQPKISETKVLAGKVVFRGAAQMHLLYQDDTGALNSVDMEWPFSQYGELERDYDPDATAQVRCEVTGLEIVRGDQGQWEVKAGLTGQYVIYHCPVIQVVEDGYSLTREAVPNRVEMPITTVLDRASQTLSVQQTVSTEAGKVIDLCMLVDHGMTRSNEGGVEITVPGVCRILYEDSQGNLQSMTAGWEENWDFPTNPHSKVFPYVSLSGLPQALVGADSITLRGDLQIDAETTSGRGMAMVSGMELGQETAPDPDRPSLILCRCGSRSLWEVAKECKTTTAAICRANALDESAATNQVLLIPIP